MTWPKMIFGTCFLTATLAVAQTQQSAPPPRYLGPPLKKDDAQAANKPHSGSRHGDWLKKYKDMPPDQQKAALENDPNFKKLPPERQEKLRQRLPPVHKTPPEPPEKNGNSHRR